MVSRHEPKHVHCEHDLKLCGHCNIVYCGKCSKEWGAPGSLWYHPYYPYYATITSTGASQILGNTSFISAHDHTGGNS